MNGDRLLSAVFPQAESDGTSTLLIAVLAVACFALLGFAVYFLILQPRRRRRPLLRAVPLLASDEREKLQEAERLLSEAVTAGLRKRDLAEARFALGFVRGMLGRDEKSKYQEAATAIAELKATRDHDPETAYLDLWLQSRLENHDNVCELYDAHAEKLGDRLQAKLIASISYLHKAGEHWRRREVERALEYFDFVRDLGVLRSQLPGQVNDLQVVNGIQAVFDDRLEDARASFAGARDRARERGASTVEADLGLVVCDWKAGDMAGVDGALSAIVQELETRASDAATTSSGRDENASPDAEEMTAEQQEEKLLRSNAGLLFAVSLLVEWLARLPARGDLPDDEHDELRRRIARVLDADPDFGDAYLVLGLIDYYFAAGEAQRSSSIDTLDEGTGKARGIKLPEVLDLIERERRLAEEERDALSRYLTLVGAYLTDSGVPLELRVELKRRLEELARYRELGEIDLTAEEHAAAPSIDDVRNRGSLLRQRIHRLVAPHLRGRPGDDGTEVLKNLLESLDAATKVVAEGVEELQLAEHDLMLRTGEFLLPEDQVAREETTTIDA